ncbi:MAG: hypothetical protein ACR2ND_15645 [Solirubrobacteraceae bacterium]
MTTGRRRALGRMMTVLAAAIVAGQLTGCAGLKDPYQAPTRTTRSAPTTATATATTPADASDPAPERGGTIPERLQSAQGRLAAGAARPSPQAALERYALLYVNWNAADVAATERQLASISLGQARAQASQAAASAARDTLLTRSRVHNTGQLVAVAQGQGAAGGQWVIVTRELTTGQGDYAGLPPSLHVNYAQVTHRSSGWVVSEWAPQN